MQKQKVRRIKVLAAGRGRHVSHVCVLAQAAPVPTVPGLGAAALCQFLQGLCSSPPLESSTGEGGVGLRGDVINNPSQLWRLIPSAVFPSFLITQMTTIVISPTGTASPEDTTSPHAQTLPSSPSISSHSSHLMPFPTPSPAGPTAEAGKEKKENNNEKDAFCVCVCVCGQKRAVIFVCNIKWGLKTQLQYAGKGHSVIHPNSDQGRGISMWDEEQSLPLLPHSQPLVKVFSSLE